MSLVMVAEARVKAMASMSLMEKDLMMVVVSRIWNRRQMGR